MAKILKYNVDGREFYVVRRWDWFELRYKFLNYHKGFSDWLDDYYITCEYNTIEEAENAYYYSVIEHELNMNKKMKEAERFTVVKRLRRK